MPASIVLNVNGKKPQTINIEPEADLDALKNNISSNMPVGTIISSILPFEKFRAIMGDDGNWTSKSKWAPADGRQIFGSDLHSLSDKTILSVPDLRGQFLRGLNQFSTDEVTPVSDERKDPENRKAGDPQKDAFQGHQHDVPGSGGAAGMKGFWTGKDNNRILDNHSEKIVSDTHNGTPRVADETRPKNVAVYYYVKINN